MKDNLLLNSAFITPHSSFVNYEPRFERQRQSLIFVRPLRRFVRPRVALEHCDMCNAELALILKKAENKRRNSRAVICNLSDAKSPENHSVMTREIIFDE
jgi:hypothetical protein